MSEYVITITELKDECTGCSGCYNVCPSLAIEMSTDMEGFSYPVINPALCNDCGLCRQVCPVISRICNSSNANPPVVYAAWSLNEEIRYNSTSGGIFSELASFIIKNKGYVVAAQYNESHTVEHYVINNINDLHRLRQSKYIQSNIALTYRKIKKLLNENKTVMFCGTPCQAAALRKYLKDDYHNLILCDFICRGVISPKVYLKYLESIQMKYRKQVKRVVFKDKSSGWNRFSTKIIFTDGDTYIRDRFNDSYMVGYLQYNISLRPSCYNCQFKSLPRISDITLADFWGISATRPHLDENIGTSLVMINSTKGRALFERIKEQVFYEECTFSEAERGNDCIHNSVTSNTLRSSFFNDLNILPYDKLINKYYINHQILVKVKSSLYKLFVSLISIHLALLRKIKRKICAIAHH